MAIWKDQAPASKSVAPPVATDFTPRPDITPVDVARSSPARESRESLIAPEIQIEGKIEGSGHVRIAGRFKGDVNVKGNLAIETGAKLTGAVKAATVTIGGELEGNVDSASRVELLDTGVLTGDLKAGSLTVAAGSRMRGQVEFGWDDGVRPITSRVDNVSSA